MFGVLAVASLCLARPEAHPAPLLAHSVAAPLPAPVFAHAVEPVVHAVAPVAPVAPVLPVAHAVAHHAPAPLVHHAPLAAAHVVDPVALTHGAVHQVTPFVDLGRKKREADAEADAEADPYAYHYSSVSTPYAHYGTFVPDHPVVAHVAAPVAHGYYGYPYAGYFGHYGYP